MNKIQELEEQPEHLVNEHNTKHYCRIREVQRTIYLTPNKINTNERTNIKHHQSHLNSILQTMIAIFFAEKRGLAITAQRKR